MTDVQFKYEVSEGYFSCHLLDGQNIISIKLSRDELSYLISAIISSDIRKAKKK